MIESKPSITAVSVAIWRDSHQLLDKATVFDDPLALTIIGKKMADALRVGQSRWSNNIAVQRLRANRAFLIINKMVIKWKKNLMVKKR